MAEFHSNVFLGNQNLGIDTKIVILSAWFQSYRTFHIPSIMLTYK